MIGKINMSTIRLGRLFSTRKVFIEVYGCQMNTNDAEIVHGILSECQDTKYEKCDSLNEANIVLLMTCAIRENAESKIWNRLNQIKVLEKSFGKSLTVGVLGCMAERLKSDLLERSKTVDVVCGPDAYRDLPKLLKGADNDRERNINVSLSADETYADISPVRLDSNKKTAFVSIMRGCNNMCAFCIVPFVRGRERSRPIDSIMNEVKDLADRGIKEITLLGQNVNSYVDDSTVSIPATDHVSNNAVPGFVSVYKKRKSGLQFTDLLERLSDIAPDVRFRFTSPHPKDFPESLLHLINSKKNICKQIHLPAQSGSSSVLERMRRGYTRDSYLKLVDRIREIIPSVSLSSDFISGFVGETEEDHKQTLELIDLVGYDMAYMYAYSMREKTMAHRRYIDDVLEDVKQRRLREVVDLFYSKLPKLTSRYVGTRQLVLIDGLSKKDSTLLQGRTDTNKTVVLKSNVIGAKIGDFVETHLTGLSNTTLLGEAVKFSSVSEFKN